ncbi:MAG TPA: glycosyltransferase [Patescibacteria group bacterium]|nr:glycosyltransferase [Patescibacteria group bacterium]
MRKVVVLLPTFNEKANIRKFTEEVLAQEKNLPGYRVEVLVVDSNSPDGTGEEAKKLAKENSRVHFLEVGRGLGVALIEGHQYSLKNLKPDVLAQIDADGQVEVDIVPRLVKAIDEGFDLAIGSRFVEGGRNKLSLSRRIFSAGSSLVCRVIMGPWDIKEFGNSARAFTPELFKKINLDRLPWKEKTFIIQPAFLNEAILAGAKYKEIPLVFKNRAEGYSKNKIINYTYDVITYSIDARLHKWGINFPLFKATRRAKTLIKFGIVGFTGTAVDFLFYKLFIWYLGLPPATSKGFSTEIAIINNFALNNAWTFRHRKTTKNIYQRFVSFQLVSLFGLAIAVGIVKGLDLLFGNGFVDLGFKKVAFNNFYFFATIPPVMAWNFVVNHYFTWKHEEDSVGVS